MMELRSSLLQIPEDASAAFEDFYQRGWTDGLPIIPPTASRTQQMLDGAGRDPAEILATMPPRMAPISVEKVAANAVMAGCLPEYFSVVLAAIEAICDPDFNLRGVNSTTNPACVMTVVNGPIREQLDINCSYGCMGPGWRANATIGRAIRLVQLNIGGAVPGSGTKSTHGQPGRFTLCFGEFEEKNPWEPLHVERGFQPGDSTVTVFSATSLMHISDTNSKTAEGTLTTIAHSLDYVGSSLMSEVLRPHVAVLVLCPDHAMVIHREGLSKEDVKRFLHENTRVPLSRFAKEKHGRLHEGGRVQDGLVALRPSQDDFVVIVAGGPTGYHSMHMPTWGHSLPVTKLIRTAGR